MSLPELNEEGDLPVGIHLATIEEVATRFGNANSQRDLVTQRLLRIHTLARSTGKLAQFVVFGSYVSDEPAPNDVDVFLVMEEEFEWEQCDEATKALFVHTRADVELGASVFWVKASAAGSIGINQFLEQWQIKRDLTKRGIIEVVT